MMYYIYLIVEVRNGVSETKLKSAMFLVMFLMMSTSRFSFCKYFDGQLPILVQIQRVLSGRAKMIKFVVYQKSRVVNVAF